MTNPFGDAGDADCMARDPLEDADSATLRTQLATCPEAYGIDRMSNSQVRARVREFRAMGRLPVEAERTSWLHARPNVPSAPEVPTAAVGAAVHMRVSAEKRYPLIAALAYQSPRLFLNRAAAFRCKLENEFTGPESRRSGPIKPGDPMYSDLRRRDLREGNYTLALTRPPLTACKLKVSRPKL